MSRTIIRISAVIITITIIVSSIFQIKFEQYIQNQKKEYGILLNRNRVSYKPVVLYLIMDKKQYMGAGSLVYQESDSNSILAGRLYDGYIVYCYFSKKELTAFWNNKQ